MSVDVEPKRRGRPSKAEKLATEERKTAERDEVTEHIADQQAVSEAWRTRPADVAGEDCPRCRRPMERSTKLLRRYEMAAVRCHYCRHVAIEGDTQFWDVATAVAGSPPVILRRAMGLYEHKHGVVPPPPAEYDGLYEAATSESGDQRWAEAEL